MSDLCPTCQGLGRVCRECGLCAEACACIAWKVGKRTCQDCGGYGRAMDFVEDERKQAKD